MFFYTFIIFTIINFKQLILLFSDWFIPSSYIGYLTTLNIHGSFYVYFYTSSLVILLLLVSLKLFSSYFTNISTYSLNTRLVILVQVFLLLVVYKFCFTILFSFAWTYYSWDNIYNSIELDYSNLVIFTLNIVKYKYILILLLSILSLNYSQINLFRYKWLTLMFTVLFIVFNYESIFLFLETQHTSYFFNYNKQQILFYILDYSFYEVNNDLFYFLYLTLFFVETYFIQYFGK